MTLNDKFHALLKEHHSNYEKVFEKMAEHLFNNYCLKANGKTYYLTEIEFYYYNKGTHPDPWCYRQPDPDKHNIFRGSDTLWFHYSGMDITFDNEAKNEYGGILIRGIQSADTNQEINGPLKSLNTLLNTNKDTNKSVCLELILEPIPRSFQCHNPIPATRYGLNLKDNEKNKATYQKRLYNYKYKADNSPQ